MSIFALFGAIELGLIFGLAAIAVFLSFRVLDFPDLSVDGTFPLGAAISAVLILKGMPPLWTIPIAILGGMLAGAVTGWLHVRLKILRLLASILTMIALYSINLRVMGRPNIPLLKQQTVFTTFQQSEYSVYLMPLVFLGILVVAVLLTRQFLISQIGLAMRATGANPKMAEAQGVSTGNLTILGMAISNGIVALAGALFAQSQGFADASLGIGVIIFGLAAVIGGEAIIPSRTIILALVGCVVGSILYRIAVGLALNADFLGFRAQDLNLITSILVVIAIIIPNAKASPKFHRIKKFLHLK